MQIDRDVQRAAVSGKRLNRDDEGLATNANGVWCAEVYPDVGRPCGARRARRSALCVCVCTQTVYVYFVEAYAAPAARAQRSLAVVVGATGGAT